MQFANGGWLRGRRYTRWMPTTEVVAGDTYNEFLDGPQEECRSISSRHNAPLSKMRIPRIVRNLANKPRRVAVDESPQHSLTTPLASFFFRASMRHRLHVAHPSACGLRGDSFFCRCTGRSWQALGQGSGWFAFWTGTGDGSSLLRYAYFSHARFPVQTRTRTREIGRNESISTECFP